MRSFFSDMATKNSQFFSDRITTKFCHFDTLSHTSYYTSIYYIYYDRFFRLLGNIIPNQIYKLKYQRRFYSIHKSLTFVVNHFLSYRFLFLLICATESNRLEKFDHFSQPKHGYDNVGGDIGSPTSFDEIERPPLRHVDKYVRAELFGLSARYTVAFMAMMGFIISFGMKCNLSPAKMERDHASWNGVSISFSFVYSFFSLRFTDYL